MNIFDMDADELNEYMAGEDVVICLPHYLLADWRECWGAHCVGMYLFAQTAKMTGVKRVVFASTTAYYGLMDGMRHMGHAVTEAAPHVTQYAFNAEYMVAEADKHQIAYMSGAIYKEE